MYNREDWVQRDATKELEEWRESAKRSKQAITGYNHSEVIAAIVDYDSSNPPKQQPVKLWDWEGIE